MGDHMDGVEHPLWGFAAAAPGSEVTVIEDVRMPLNKALLVKYPESFISRLDVALAFPSAARWRDYPCREWTGTKNKNGYGVIQITVGSKRPKIMVHRLAYQLHVGPIPKGKHLDHLCRNRACWEPTHLEPVTNRENTLRGINAKRRG